MKKIKKIDDLNRRLKIRQDRLDRLKNISDPDLDIPIQNEKNMIDEINQELKKERKRERKKKLNKINKNKGKQ
jgi:hypothetical protein